MHSKKKIKIANRVSSLLILFMLEVHSTDAQYITLKQHNLMPPFKNDISVKI